jgi:hypothetical protein
VLNEAIYQEDIFGSGGIGPLLLASALYGGERDSDFERNSDF